MIDELAGFAWSMYHEGLLSYQELVTLLQEISHGET
jgi:hypothetical protein